MGRSPRSDTSESKLKKGAWTEEEDKLLINYMKSHGIGDGSWRSLPKAAGLLRCGKSCRLRWTNYLRPDIKRGNFTQEEEQAITQLQSTLGNNAFVEKALNCTNPPADKRHPANLFVGNLVSVKLDNNPQVIIAASTYDAWILRWSQIADHFPGRTDNEIKNYWNTHIRRKLFSQGPNPKTHCPLNIISADNNNNDTKPYLEILGALSDDDLSQVENSNRETTTEIDQENNNRKTAIKIDQKEHRQHSEALSLELSLGLPCQLQLENFSN